MADTLTITDNRTGKQYEIPIQDGTIRAMDLRQIKVVPDEFGMMTYDPAFMNTAACRSRITYIDGDKGILLYRGYPIEQLAERSDFLETAYLILFGELPTEAQHQQWTHDITQHTMLHTNISKLMEGFQYRRPPDGHVHQHGRRAVDVLPRRQEHLLERVAAPADDPPHRQGADDCRLRLPPLDRPALQPARQRPELLGQLPEHALQDDRDEVHGRTRCSSARSTCCSSCTPITSRTAAPARCGTSAARRPIRTRRLAGAAAALYGPLHGGANEAVLRMLAEIGSIKNVPAFIKRVKGGDGRLMGFGHRVYKSYDPRAAIIKRIADLVFEVTGKNPLLEIALELERIALEDEYFVTRKLYPNVDFYSGLIYQAMGFPVDMFPVLFAIPRTAGWIAQWEEMLLDPDQKIARPRQIYIGPAEAGLRVARQAALTRPTPMTCDRTARRDAVRGCSRCCSSAWACVQAQTPAPAAPAFDGARATNTCGSSWRSGPRVAGTPGAKQARDYIAAQMKALGLTVEEQAFEAATPIGPVEMVNLRVTIPGGEPRRQAQQAG